MLLEAAYGALLSARDSGSDSSSDGTGPVVDGISPVSMYSGMVPNLAFNIAMLVIWSLLLAFHTTMVWRKQYWFSIAFMCAGIMEVIGYVGRVISHYNVFKIDPFLMQMVCLTIAPVFTMGGVYYQLAKLIEIYGHRFSLLPSPMAYSYIFIACDIISLVIQAAGGGQSGSAATSGTNTDVGDNIFVGGLAVQVASMTIFICLMLHLFYKVFVQTRIDHAGVNRLSWSLFKIPQTEIDYMYRKKFQHVRLNPDRWVFHYFPFALALAVFLIFVRCCYRLAELAEGWGGNLITHENYFIILDALMMAAATTILTVFHPGLAFRGREVTIKITRGHVDPETLQDLEKEKYSGEGTSEDDEKSNHSTKNAFLSFFRRKASTRSRTGTDTTTVKLEQASLKESQ